MSSKYRFAPIERLGSVASTALLVEACCEGVLAIWSIVYLGMLFNIGSLPMETVTMWERLGLAAYGQIVVFFVVAAIVGRWIYRVSANTHAAIRKLDTSPGWAVGWYFIPFANLWKPFEAMSEIVRANIALDAGRPQLGLWWGLWLTANIVGNIGGRVVGSASDIPMLIFGSGLTLVSGLATLGAALSLRRIVRRLTDAQNARKAVEVF